MNSSTTIAEVTTMEQEVLDALVSLVPQLSATCRLPTYSQIAELVASSASRLFVARDSATETIVGTLTLVIFRTPTGLRASIEDFVVDEEFRGCGIGRLMCKRAIEAAKQKGAGMIDLTSNASREAANRMYESMGFEIRETNIYRKRLDE